MKKVNKNSNIPSELNTFIENYPNDTWENFKDKCQTGYIEILKEIKQNQGGICCYCEIDFYDKREIRDDFRVEHFHPKSDKSNPNINWNLIWKNLFGCCLGGSDKTVLQTTRFIQNKKHRHSDILKDNNNWDDEILNPLEIPAFPPIFKVNSKGVMEVLEENCNEAKIEVLKAQNCLDEKKLNLNSPFLTEWRETVIAKLVDEFEKELERTDDYEQAMSDIIAIYLSKDANNNFHPFFTTIRSHFEEDAEKFLKDNNYNG